jgi:hypothetical protein
VLNPEEARVVMKIATWYTCLVLLAAPLTAQAAPAPPAEEAAADRLGQMIHTILVAKLPKKFVDESEWGQTIPLPERLRLPRARRTFVKVGDHMEVPDGVWRKVRLRLDDADRDLGVRVRSLIRQGPTTGRLTVDADVLLHADADVQRWRNGLLLADVNGRADVALGVLVECDVSIRLHTAGPLSWPTLDPDIKDLHLTLKRFSPERVTLKRAGVVVEGEPVVRAGEELKGVVQAVLTAAEPKVKKRAGEALARALKGGESPLTAANLIKAAAPLLKENQLPERKGPTAPPPVPPGPAPR